MGMLEEVWTLESGLIEPECKVFPWAMQWLQEIAREADALMPIIPACKVVPDCQRGAQVYFDAPNRKVHLIVSGKRDVAPFMYVAVRTSVCWLTGTLRNPTGEMLVSELGLLVASVENEARDRRPRDG